MPHTAERVQVRHARADLKPQHLGRQKDQKFKIILSHETVSKIKNKQSKIFCVIETNAIWHWISTVNAAHEQSELDYWQECFNNIIQNYLQEHGVNLQRESLRKVTPQTRNTTTKAKGLFRNSPSFCLQSLNSHCVNLANPTLPNQSNKNKLAKDKRRQEGGNEAPGDSALIITDHTCGLPCRMLARPPVFSLSSTPRLSSTAGIL